MKYSFYLIVISLLAIIYSCEEEQESTKNLQADAYIRAMKIDNKIKYSPIFLATTTVAPQKVTVTDTKDKNDGLALEKYWNNTLKFRWLPDAENYTTTVEPTATYEFIATFDSAEKKVTESVKLSDVPQAFEITATKYDKEKNEFYIEWSNAQADTYMIQITNKLDEYPNFQTLNLRIDKTKNNDKIFTILDNSSLKWFKSPNIGAKYLLCIHAFNLQGEDKVNGEFIATKEIEWGK